MNTILIVTPDIEGPIRNGGIGTAFTSLSNVIASTGHQIDVLYTTPISEVEGKPIEYWEKIYKNHNINLIPLPFPEELTFTSPYFRNKSYLIYHWLKEHNQYQTIIGCEWQANLYYTLLAKKQGLNFLNTRFIINTHSSTLWADEGNYQLPYGQDNIELYFMEQKTVEMADEVISPSQYLLDWMSSKKWKLPNKTQVILNCEPFPLKEPEKKEKTTTKLFDKNEELEKIDSDKIKLVFFGRLETRKGLDIFLKSLELLTFEQFQAISKITFLGKNVSIHGVDSSIYIQNKIISIEEQILKNITPEQLKVFQETQRSENLSKNIDTKKTNNKKIKLNLDKKINILTNYNRLQAHEYIKHKNVLVVIPSLVENSPYTVYECLLNNINFIASDIGGIPELIKVEQRKHILFKLTPVELYKSFSYRINNLQIKAELSHNLKDIHQQWLVEINKPTITVSPKDIPSGKPKVSVCLTHHDRHTLLQQAITSLQNQTYDNFEVILIDDGSTDKQTHRYLDIIQPFFNERGWKIIKSTNNYLGAARNLAAKYAEGEYLLFMDDDNVAKPHEISTFVKAALYSKADILTTPSEVIDSKKYPSNLKEKTTYWLPMGGDLNTGSFQNCFGDANAFIKKSVFDALGGFTEDYGIGHEDWEFFAKAVSSGYILNVVPESLFYYRVLNTGMFLSGNSARNLFRSYRPFMDPEGKTPYALGLIPALYDKIHYLESELNHCKGHSHYNEIYAIKDQLNYLFSQQQDGWANDRFNVLNEKLDALTSQQQGGWAHDRFNVLNEKLEKLTSQDNWINHQFHSLSSKIEILISEQQNILNDKMEKITINTRPLWRKIAHRIKYYLKR
ncbi:glycosyltransferase [Commensalibacter intestini]|nr:glycosyltransferase [Commensalibacter intestini]